MRESLKQSLAKALDPFAFNGKGHEERRADRRKFALERAEDCLRFFRKPGQIERLQGHIAAHRQAIEDGVPPPGEEQRAPAHGRR